MALGPSTSWVRGPLGPWARWPEGPLALRPGVNSRNRMSTFLLKTEKSSKNLTCLLPNLPFNYVQCLYLFNLFADVKNVRFYQNEILVR